jgi:hypothetical protein
MKGMSLFSTRLPWVAATAFLMACLDLTIPPQRMLDAGFDASTGGTDVRQSISTSLGTGGMSAQPGSGGAAGRDATADAPMPVGGTDGGAGGMGGTVPPSTADSAVVNADVGLVLDVSLPSDLRTPGTGGSGTGGSGGGGTVGAGGTGKGGSGSGGTVTGTGGNGGATTGTDGNGTGGKGTGGGGQGGTGGGQGGTGASPMIISIDFVGGVPGGAGTVAMGAGETAGAKPASHWNSAGQTSGSRSSLVAGDGTTTGASVTWNTPVVSGKSGIWSVWMSDAPGDARMMNGYLDPWANASPAVITMSGLPAPLSSGYDVYVYCYGYVDSGVTLSYQYAIGTTTRSVRQVGPSATTFPGHTLAPEGGSGTYVVFKNVSGSSFTLTAQPVASTTTLERAPVNGIQVVYPPGS